jgi:hypothetical protein
MNILLKNIPESINDCSLEQIVKIIQLSKKEMDINLRKQKLFYILIEDQGNILDKISYAFNLQFKPWYAKTMLGKLLHSEQYLNIDLHVPTIDYDEINADILDTTEFIFDEKDVLSRQKCWKIGNTPPEDYFGNVTYRQFRNADAELYAILENKEITGQLDITDAFVKELYLIDNEAPLKLTDEIRHIIFMYYIGNRQQLKKEFPFVFPSGSGSSKSTYESYVEMWENILDAIAEKPQHYEAVDNLNVRSVLKNLNRKFELDQLNKPK